jgi:hypothetical protein
MTTTYECDDNKSNLQIEFTCCSRETFHTTLLHLYKMSIIPTIRLLIGIVLLAECTLGIVSNILISIVMVKSTRMRQLSVCYIIAMIALNDALFAASCIGPALVELRSYSNTNNITQFECTVQNVGMY